MNGSWITTLIGCLGAVANVLVPLLDKGSVVDANTIVQSIIMALLGFFAKDYNKTGTGK